MSEEKRSFVLCARLQRNGDLGSEADEVMAGQPVVRRLNRMERVAFAYDGKVVRRTDELLLISFETAKAAVFAACEMQRRCAGLPQVSRGNLTLGIGIHKASPHVVARSPLSLLRSAERRDLKRRFGFDTAKRLAERAPENAIAISSLVANALDSALLESSVSRRDEETDLPSYTLNWQNVHMRSDQSPLPDTPTPATKSAHTLVLTRDGKRIELSRMNSIITFGRDPGCDVMVSDQFASRLHARIEIRDQGCILTDQSANGTCIQMPDGIEVLIRDKHFLLPAHGRLAFGHSVSRKSQAVFDFETTPR